MEDILALSPEVQDAKEKISKKQIEQKFLIPFIFDAYKF